MYIRTGSYDSIIFVTSQPITYRYSCLRENLYCKQLGKDFQNTPWSSIDTIEISVHTCVAINLRKTAL